MTDPINALSERVAEAMELRGKATAGPWMHKRLGVIVGGKSHQYANGNTQAQLCMATAGNEGEHPIVENAEFIAASHAHVDLIRDLFSALQEAQKAAQWQTVEQFQSEANEGWCWIVYKFRVTEAYHDHEQRFRFHRLSTNVFMTECISAVMPWDRPAPPDQLPSN